MRTTASRAARRRGGFVRVRRRATQLGYELERRLVGADGLSLERVVGHFEGA